MSRVYVVTKETVVGSWGRTNTEVVAVRHDELAAVKVCEGSKPGPNDRFAVREYDTADDGHNRLVHFKAFARNKNCKLVA